MAKNKTPKVTKPHNLTLPEADVEPHMLACRDEIAQSLDCCLDEVGQYFDAAIDDAADKDVVLRHRNDLRKAVYDLAESSLYSATNAVGDVGGLLDVDGDDAGQIGEEVGRAMGNDMRLCDHERLWQALLRHLNPQQKDILRKALG